MQMGQDPPLTTRFAMARGLQGGKDRYPITTNIPQRVDIKPIAAVDRRQKTLYVEVINGTRQTCSITMDTSSLILSGTGAFRQFSSGANDISVGNGKIVNGQVGFNLPGLSIIQLIISLGG